MHVRSGSQKTLLVVSIIEIITGALAFFAGLMTMIAGGFMGFAVSGAPEQLAESGLTAAEAGEISLAASFLAVIIIVTGLFSIVEGILGVRAANDASKIMPVWILSIISLVCGAIALVATIMNGSFGANGLSNIVDLLIDGFMFWIANNIKAEAGV